ncbi:6-pyruvoyltetrahydropterin/6-carboxytetrahydropterin synthase [Methanohalophilus levihalophilus]|uniref:6-carboxytetrahydropterin synthase QueD n=1 Tax=Methanohalophilus levihalophilus TaxID=1431282 RepID=UPI001FDA6D8B|nr:6-carboxytetrahydropterin synthase QueD [Methanohalophilus levihalophilus]MBP2031009.1 6-pyruvoyltetrahydropterin/6-carboxytetrahydropterin synthase [Methanohalophilus levihalophilus]
MMTNANTKMKLGIVEYIDSAHYLPGHETCGIVHGHTYKTEIVIEGEKKETGMVMDFYEIKTTVREVLKEFDHRLLNDILEFPSAENMCEAIHARLSEALGYPVSVKVWEGEGKWCQISDFD